MEDARKTKGLEIAATTRITKNGDAWIVPSQTCNGKYTVTHAEDGFHCSCPDHELRRVKCKHAFAVEFATYRETAPDGTTRVTTAMRVTYTQNWPAYNAAQTTEKETFCRLLHDLCGTVESPAQGKGRPRYPLGDAIFSAAFKVYSTVSGRRFMTDMRDAETRGLVVKAPCYNMIFKAMESANLTPIIKKLVEASALPLRSVETDFAVDSTGFGLGQFYRHYSAKYGHAQYSQDYLKVHAIVGVRTHIIAAVEVTDRDTHDSTQFKSLVETTASGFDVEEVSADKAYSSRASLALVEGLGAAPFVPFKSNSKGDKKAPIWDRLFHYYQFNRDDFLTHYHKRSNVESAFSAMKRKFGDFIRSKTPIAQTNEALLKVLVHNIVCLVHSIHELGIDVAFGAPLPTKSLACP